MKLIVIHDKAGNILRLIAHPEDVPPARPDLEEGERVTEIYGFDAPLDDLDAVRERLRDLTDNYRLESEGGDNRLVRR